MNFKGYLKDKLFAILITFITLGTVYLIFMAFKINTEMVIAILVIWLVSNSMILLIDYFRKKKFYSELLDNIEGLDKSYLVLETLENPEFYEGKLLYQALYEIDKSFLENVNKIEKSQKDFKEYVEMWIHEVKIPLASLILTLNNHKNELNPKIKTQIKRLEDYVDQVLYYVRSENAEKDYLIKEISLGNIIRNVGLKNMDDLLENNIEFIVENANVKVLSDSKWLEFILNQIINNSIKYRREDVDSFIKIYCLSSNDSVTLILEDNGVGISEFDLPRVFDKTFTGSNGRNNVKSTGMGLFIVKNLCAKLGHKIIIDSVSGEYTKVFITISKNEFYDVLK